MTLIAVEPIPHAELADELLRPSFLDRNRTYSASPLYYLSISAALNSTSLPLRLTDRNGHTSIVLGRLRKEASRARLGYLNIRLPHLLTYTIIYQGIFGRCDPDAIARTLARWLRRQYGVEQLVFTKLPAASELAQSVQSTRLSTALTAEAHWRLELPDTFEALLAQHSSKHRQRLRWERRKLEDSMNGQMNHVVLGSVDETSLILQTCEAISGHTYHATVGGMVRDDHVWRTVLTTLAESGSLACHQFRHNNDPLAFVLTAHHGGIVHILAMAHLPEHSRYSPGKHLLLEVIRQSCESGLRWIDYGFGDAQYKRVYGSHCEWEMTLLQSAPTLKAQFANRTVGTAATLNNTVQRIAGTTLAGRVKRRWRSLAAGRTKALRLEGSDNE
ncbi:MAG: GNAT family N-acetyltransferase [Phycisphaerales bacterium JB054]